MTLDGSGSFDLDTDPLTFSWQFLSVPEGSGASLSDPTSVLPTLVADVFGEYDLELVVNDGTVDSDPDTVKITTGNTPPEAEAGPEQTVPLGANVQLDGSGSSDVDNDPLTFQWSFTARPAGSAATLSDPTAGNPTFDADVAGTYVGQLIVNDGTVDSAPDHVVIDTENSRPTANAGPDQTVLVGDTVTLDGSGSSDPDGDPLTFQWALTVVPAGSAAGLSDPTAVMPTFVADVAGDYVAQLIVNDGQVDSVPDTVLIRALAGQLLACGDLAPGSIDQAGQEEFFTFEGQAGDVVDLSLAETGGAWTGRLDDRARATVFAPSGAQVTSFVSDGQQQVTLPESGTYVVRVNGDGFTITGSYDLSLACN